MLSLPQLTFCPCNRCPKLPTHFILTSLQWWVSAGCAGKEKAAAGARELLATSREQKSSVTSPVPNLQITANVQGARHMKSPRMEGGGIKIHREQNKVRIMHPKAICLDYVRLRVRVRVRMRNGGLRESATFRFAWWRYRLPAVVCAQLITHFSWHDFWVSLNVAISKL